jgi:hypothetical protein
MCSLVLSIFSFPWNENAFSHHLMKSTWKKNDSCLFFLLHAVMKLVATKNTLAHVTWKPTIYFIIGHVKFKYSEKASNFFKNLWNYNVTSLKEGDFFKKVWPSQNIWTLKGRPKNIEEFKKINFAFLPHNY